MLWSNSPAASAADRHLDRDWYRGELACAIACHSTPIAAGRVEPETPIPRAGLPPIASAGVLRRAPHTPRCDRSAHLPPGTVVRGGGARLDRSQNGPGSSTLAGPAGGVRAGR